MDKRVENALKQHIHLISADLSVPSFIVEGESSRQYTITMKRERFQCTCPDYMYRRNDIAACKHIYFLVFRVAKHDQMPLGSEMPALVHDIQKRLRNIETKVQKENTEHKEEITEVGDNDCSICFEAMTTSLVKCEHCKNNFHTKCMKHWLSNSARKNCPLCRGFWKTEHQQPIQYQPVDEFARFVGYTI